MSLHVKETSDKGLLRKKKPNTAASIGRRGVSREGALTCRVRKLAKETKKATVAPF